MVINKTNAVETSIHAVSPELILLTLTKVGLVRGGSTAGSGAGMLTLACGSGAASLLGKAAATLVAVLAEAASCAHTGAERLSRRQIHVTVTETKRIRHPRKFSNYAKALSVPVEISATVLEGRYISAQIRA